LTLFFAALRLYFLVIPLFAWIFSVWALVAVAPLYVYVVYHFEDISFLQDDLDGIMAVPKPKNHRGHEDGEVDSKGPRYLQIDHAVDDHIA
jgi:hypothetical protein